MALFSVGFNLGVDESPRKRGFEMSFMKSFEKMQFLENNNWR